MTLILWIAVGAAALMIAAHILLFWWFLARPEKNKPDPECLENPGADETQGDR